MQAMSSLTKQPNTEQSHLLWSTGSFRNLGSFHVVTLRRLVSFTQCKLSYLPSVFQPSGKRKVRESGFTFKESRQKLYGSLKVWFHCPRQSYDHTQLQGKLRGAFLLCTVQSQLCHLMTVRDWESCLTSLGLFSSL